MGFDFETSQIAATLVAMTSNFALNNVLTYYDRRLSGWAWVKGWFSFALASSIGAIANVGIATYLFAGAGNSLAPVGCRGGAGRCRLELHRYIHFYMETSLKLARYEVQGSSIARIDQIDSVHDRRVF